MYNICVYIYNIYIYIYTLYIYIYTHMYLRTRRRAEAGGAKQEVVVLRHGEAQHDY